MWHRSIPSDSSTWTVRPVRVLVEDPAVAGSTEAEASVPFDVIACAGPSGAEACPLVTDGICPHGPVDVVVSALDGPWAASVRAAWTQTGTPLVVAADVASTDPGTRLRHHLGAAVQHLWPT